MLGDLALMMTPVLRPVTASAAEVRRTASGGLRVARGCHGRGSPLSRARAARRGSPRFEPTTENLAQLQTALLATLPPMLRS